MPPHPCPYEFPQNSNNFVTVSHRHRRISLLDLRIKSKSEQVWASLSLLQNHVSYRLKILASQRLSVFITKLMQIKQDLKDWSFPANMKTHFCVNWQKTKRMNIKMSKIAFCYFAFVLFANLQEYPSSIHLYSLKHLWYETVFRETL